MQQRDYFILAAALFAMIALPNLVWPQKVKQVFDRAAKCVGTEKYMAGVGDEYYRMIGVIYAICALLFGAACFLPT